MTPFALTCSDASSCSDFVVVVHFPRLSLSATCQAFLFSRSFRMLIDFVLHTVRLIALSHGFPQVVDRKAFTKTEDHQVRVCDMIQTHLQPD